MRAKDPNQAGAGRPGVAGLLVWVGMFLFGLFALIFVSAALGPSHKGLVWPVVVVVCFVVFFCIQAACHPLRGRSDQTQCWREKFPTRDEREVQRFLQVIGESLGLKEERMRALRPEDLTQEVFCGDGMDLVELMMAIEEAYALEFPDSLLGRVRTLGDLFEYVTRQASAHAGPPA
jgi:acyl carrier protein